MADGLFQGLPPPSAPHIRLEGEEVSKIIASDVKESAVLAPALKSALKRSKSSRINAYDGEGSSPVSDPPLKSAIKRPTSPEYGPQGTVLEKRCRFKTIADAPETQILEAIQKISSHIRCPGKFSKASKLAVQLIQSGSVNGGMSDCFFGILEAAMSSPTSCTDVSVRADFHALFSESQVLAEFLDYKQRNQLATWTLRAVVANDLFTDDSFVFSRATSRIKEAISSLPIAMEDKEEAIGAEGGREDEEDKRFLKSQSESLVLCLEIGANRYKTPWCQTGMDILAKHAFDNVERFRGNEQRDAIRRIWRCLAEQQIVRKQGRCANGKKKSEVNNNGFEWLQQKYASQKISVRHSVGSTTRRAEQWLG